MEEQEIYKKAVDLWGESSQCMMVIEECAELISVICKFFRGRVTNVDIIDEAVDVQLMLNQLHNILNNNEKWNEQMKYKLDRLEARIKGEE